jgi:TolB-like protein/tetratricopeptide (TPR) repeat protein
MVQEGLSFGPFWFDPEQRELRRGGVPVQLRSRALDILYVLASARGEVVGKDELMSRVWPGLVVEENNLAVHVSALRKALDEGKSGQSYVVTVPGRGYRFMGVRSPPSSAIGHVDTSEGPALPDRPSIAVLPFQSLSGDPEQEYFADGIVEEIITALSRFSGLFVIARNSSFTYKGRAIDVKQVGRELGVRYVLEGSVRTGGHRVRITGQLIDASTGAHIWADRFDGTPEDIFDLQDHVTASVVGAISPKVEQAEIERAKRKPTENLNAYDCFLHGMAVVHKLTREAMSHALQLFSRTVELDPDFAAAYGMATWCYVQRKANRWMVNRAQEVAETKRLARKAVDLGRDDAVALSRGGYALAYVEADLDAGGVFIERAFALNPNLAFAWFANAWLRIFRGEPELALSDFAHVRRLSPFEPLMPSIQAGIAFAHFIVGDYRKASSLAEQVLQEKPDLHIGLRLAAAGNALAGNFNNAQRAMARLREIDPSLRVCDLKDLTPLRRPQDLLMYEEGMRQAGMPD